MEDRFAKFMDKVDHVFVRQLGIGYQDLPDFDYRVCFDAGLTAEETYVEYMNEYEDEL